MGPDGRPEMTTAGELPPAGVEEAAGALAAAFADYPLLRAVAGPGRRPAACAAFCRFLVRYALRHGVAHATADRAAVACWLPPGGEYLRTWRAVRCGALGLAWRLGARGALRLGRIGHALEDERRRHVPGRHWYLNLLGVRPDRRGRGLSRAVLRPGFALADRDGLPCYLETQDEVNVGVYRRLGFEVAGESEPHPGLRNWGMVRPPGGVTG